MSRLNRRVAKLVRATSQVPQPGRLDLIVYSTTAGHPDDRPPGVYPCGGGRGAEVVYAGPDPDPAVLDPLRARLAPHGLVITSHPGPIPDLGGPAD